RARLDAHEAIVPVTVRLAAPTAAEVGIERRIMLVVVMVIAPRRVALPYLHHGIRHGLAVHVRHAARHHNTLAHRFARTGTFGQVGLLGAHVRARIVGTGHLG